MTIHRRQHPTLRAYLDGEMIAEFYNKDDPRNWGEVSVAATMAVSDLYLPIPFNANLKEIMKHDGAEFEVRGTVGLETNKSDNSQTTIYRFERVTA